VPRVGDMLAVWFLEGWGLVQDRPLWPPAGELR